MEEVRNRHKELILASARRLLLEKDWNKVTLGSIALESGLSRVTVYKYFNSIDDIIYEIQIRCFNEMKSNNKEFVLAGNTGAEKLISFLQGAVEGYRSHTEQIRFIALFDYHYRVNFPSEEFRLKYKAATQDDVMGIRSLFMEGLQDGSIHSEFDSDLLSWTVSQTLFSLLQRMAVRGPLIHKQWGIEPDEVIRYLSLFIGEFVKVKPNLAVFKKGDEVTE